MQEALPHTQEAKQAIHDMFLYNSLNTLVWDFREKVCGEVGPATSCWRIDLRNRVATQSSSLPAFKSELVTLAHTLTYISLLTMMPVSARFCNDWISFSLFSSLPGF